MERVKFLNTPEQSAYLRETWGVVRAPKTLAKLRCVGGGPQFVKHGRAALSTEPWLDAWVENGLSEPKRSTSDVGGADDEAA
jgi:hypothetical protein